MKEVIIIGIDLAKSVFQVHGIDSTGEAVVRRQLKRQYVLKFFEKLPRCLVGMEACATSHHWAREIAKLGHEVRMMPPRYVKPYVKRNKNDAADAEAICEAVQRPTMRFVPIKTPQQQSVLMLHRTRQLFVRQRTTLINAIRAHLAEFGIVAGIGRNGVEALLELIAKGEDERLPAAARESAFRSGRDLSAWIGLVPKQNSTGGKERLGNISKAGNRYLRSLLVVGALSVIRRAKQLGYTRHPWLVRLMERRSTKVAAIALANKIARIAWAMMARNESYRTPQPVAT